MPVYPALILDFMIFYMYNMKYIHHLREVTMLHSRIEVKIAVFPNDNNGTHHVSELTNDKTFIDWMKNNLSFTRNSHCDEAVITKPKLTKLLKSKLIGTGRNRATLETILKETNFSRNQVVIGLRH